MHHLFSNNSAKPDPGPLSSVPAIGCEGIQETFVRLKPFTILFTSFFTDPVSVIMVPFFKWSLINKKISLYEPNGDAIITSSASFTAEVMSFVAFSHSFLSFKKEHLLICHKHRLI